MDNVLLTVMENKSYTTVTSTQAASCPYLNQLRTTGLWATGKTTGHADASNYLAAGSPSAPNYLAMTTGRLLQNGSDGYNAYSYQNLVDLLETVGVSWKAYFEDLPSNWTAHQNSGLYVFRHNPFCYFTDVLNSPSRVAKVVDFTTWTGVTERFQWIGPNLTNDGHTDPGGHSSPVTYELGFIDAWLKQWVPIVMATPQFAPGKKAIWIITFDEADASPEHVVTFFIGPGATSITSAKAYSHYTLLATLESMFGTSNLGQNDQGALVMDDMITGGGTSDSPIWTNQAISSESFGPNSTTQAPVYNESLAFAAISSEAFTPVVVSTQLIHPAIACGTQSLPATTARVRTS